MGWNLAVEESFFYSDSELRVCPWRSGSELWFYLQPLPRGGLSWSRSPSAPCPWTTAPVYTRRETAKMSHWGSRVYDNGLRCVNQIVPGHQTLGVLINTSPFWRPLSAEANGTHHPNQLPGDVQTQTSTSGPVKAPLFRINWSTLFSWSRSQDSITEMSPTVRSWFQTSAWGPGSSPVYLCLRGAFIRPMQPDGDSTLTLGLNEVCVVVDDPGN